MSTVKEYQDRYLKACHAMQSGVAMEMSVVRTDSVAPKHLRVGINSAMVSDAALARLLMDKGLFTELELHKYLAEEMEREVKRYEMQLSEDLNRPVTLG